MHLMGQRLSAKLLITKYKLCNFINFFTVMSKRWHLEFERVVTDIEECLQERRVAPLSQFNTTATVQTAIELDYNYQ